MKKRKSLSAWWVLLIAFLWLESNIAATIVWGVTGTLFSNLVWICLMIIFVLNKRITNKIVMDIGSGKAYPSNSLSNFAPHPFEIDGVHCNSMEGFLQSLKFKSVDMQREVCTLVGYAAKKKGTGKNWQMKQTLYWNGKEYNRGRQEYQDLLDRAYEQLNKNTKFRKAIEATKGMVLTHNIGKSNSKDTILTKSEFCRRLTKLRDDGTLKQIKNKDLF